VAEDAHPVVDAPHGVVVLLAIAPRAQVLCSFDVTAKKAPR
jgi:hypothetical protein